MNRSAEIIYEMETELLANIVKHLSTGAKESARWKAQKLAELGTLRAVNEKTVADSIEKAIAEARKEIEESGRSAASMIDSQSKTTLSGSLKDEADRKLKRVWETWEEKTYAEYNNIGAKLLDKADDIYKRAVEREAAAVMAGQKTLREGIAQTARELGNKGIPALVDSAGRQWSAEAYAQTVIRSNVRNVTTETQLTRAQDLNNDLVEISAHDGARPLCEPYQGKVYSLSGKDPNYPALSSTSYGEPAGLFGINCGHTMNVYFPGQKKRYEAPGKRDNDKVYKESQEQRRIERQIRDAKRQKYLAEQAGDEQALKKAQQRIRRRQAAQREHIEQTGRRRRYDREQIYT